MNLNAQQLIIWLVIGIIAGWLASLVVGGGGGLLRYLITGIIGAFVGGVIFGAAGRLAGIWPIGDSTAKGRRSRFVEDARKQGVDVLQMVVEVEEGL